MAESEVDLGVGPQQSKGVELWVELQWTQTGEVGRGELSWQEFGLLAQGEQKAGSVEESGERDGIL